MASETVRIKPETHAKLKELASKAGESLPNTLERAIDAYYREQFLADVNRAYAALRADPKAWAQELAEREAMEGTLADGLEDANK
jgi:predicted transcriptional regulator